MHSLNVRRETMINRQAYLDGRVTFEEFYREVNRLAGIKFRADHWAVIEAKEALAQGDVHLNSIPLRKWDLLASSVNGSRSLSKALEELGDFYSMAGGVCAMKQAVIDAANTQLEEVGQ
jgi:hypothetical protein